MKTSLFMSVLSTPIGELCLVAEDDALTTIYLPPWDLPEATMDPSHPVLARAELQLKAYFEGRLKVFDLPLRGAGTPFQQTVWKALCKIPYGVTVSYGHIAKDIGLPHASRAVGAANGKNPLSIVVPCHRVIGANGSLTGYGGGMDAKRWLLTHEGAWDEAPLFAKASSAS